MALVEGFHPLGPVPRLTTARRVLIGPANFSSQATLWARALDQRVPDTSAHSYAPRNEGFDFPADIQVDLETYRSDKKFHREFLDYVAANYTHVVIEAGRSLFGPAKDRDAMRDVSRLLARGLKVAFLAHGSDLRLPSRHIEIEPWSPFRNADPEEVDKYERFARRTSRMYNSYPGSVFVSTPDLLEFAPGATWCPVVVDLDVWRTDDPVMERRVPVLAHAPSQGWMKGSELVDPLLQQLHDAGEIVYRRVEGIPHSDMPAVFRGADIVIDQLAIGSYGVAACEGMAAGRVVLGHVSEATRSTVRDLTGVDLPVIEVDAETIVDRIRELMAEPEAARQAAARGRAFVEQVHAGGQSAAALSSFLDSPDRVPADWLPTPIGTRVAMVSGNDVVIDARVMKYAQTVAGWGLDVTALGVAGRAHRGRSVVAGVVVNTPVIGHPLSDPGRGLIERITPWFSNPEEQQRAKRLLEHRQRELTALQGGIRRDRYREPVATDPPDERRAGRTLARAKAGLKVRRAVFRARGIKVGLMRRWRARFSAGSDLGVGEHRRRVLTFYRRSGLARWRRALPQTLDRDFVLGPMLDKLRPDLIHVHDVFLLGVAIRAAQRAAAGGRVVRVIYDAHEYLPGLAVVDPRVVAAYCDLESEFIHAADRVITVSEPLADHLQRDHGLRHRPDVVLNAPIDPPPGEAVTDVRELLALGPETPLLVYVGGLNRARGVATAVDGLAGLPDAHLLVVAHEGLITGELRARAKKLGVVDRFHVLPYVEPGLVPDYIRTATLGLSPLLRSGNHDVALTNKFCEYVAAGLPIVTSDTPVQAQLVRELGLGTVHRANDVPDFVRAVEQALADHDRLADRIRGDEKLRHRFSWAGQAEVVRDVYTEVLGPLPSQAWQERATHISRLGDIPE
ncbi:glycosyltransferase [Aeromicrobium sp.]|uniref:glycosyltransferase n=1 Tax=Aeromicrobium sp. TaxID=1871063 RepID=UPI002FC8C788